MLIFMPYPNMRLTAHVLDNITLGEQLRATLLTLKILGDNPRIGGEHRYTVSTRMWRGHHTALIRMANCVMNEITDRGYEPPTHLLDSKEAMKAQKLPEEWLLEELHLPEWFDYTKLHASHRASLKDRHPHWYCQFGWDEPEISSLVWPGKMPRVGDWMMGADKRSHIVHSFDNQKRPVLLIDGELRPIERRDVYTRVWQRVINKD
jgi:hypothetical protein